MIMTMPKGASRSLRLFARGRGDKFVLALTGLETAAPGDATALRAHLVRLQRLRDLIEESPSLTQPMVFAGVTQTRESLIQQLCRIEELTSDVELPARASMVRTFLVQKSHFLRDLVRSADALRERNPEWDDLDRRLRAELADAIYTQLAEQLLMSLLADNEVHHGIKEQVAAQLVAVWENTEIDILDFCPWLESAWAARNRVRADLGSLMGASEYVKLMREDCPEAFLDYFAADETPEDARHGFEEFLFGVSWEELCALRAALGNRGNASREWAEEVLHRTLDSEIHTGGIDPLAIHRSFTRRHRAAETRRRANLPGPRHTAEAYMMMYMLRERISGRRSYNTMLPPLR
jgi:hypothetical protein